MSTIICRTTSVSVRFPIVPPVPRVSYSLAKSSPYASMHLVRKSSSFLKNFFIFSMSFIFLVYLVANHIKELAGFALEFEYFNNVVTLSVNRKLFKHGMCEVCRHSNYVSNVLSVYCGCCCCLICNRFHPFLLLCQC